MKTFGWFTKTFVLPSSAELSQFELQTKLALKKSRRTQVNKIWPEISLFSSLSSLVLWSWWRLSRRRNYDWTLIFLIIFHDLSIIPGFASAGKSSGSNNFGKRTVTTSFGVVRGETVIPASEDDLPAVTQYLGIPYGVAPSGQYRFNMAISAPKWTHQTKDAFRFSSVCIQSGLPQLSETEALKTMSSQRFDNIHRIFPFLKPQSEDCLYMNLYVPEKFEHSRDVFDDGNGPQLSVLVIVHGGDYGWGAGNAYNASILSAYGQTIVVTLNYRLGIYGFLGRCESNSCTGNAGLSDLVAALKMLSNILPSFGGDPSSLTLLGWGSGAALISLLMASPITQPKNRLFRRAVLLDGSALCPWAMVDNSQQYLLRVAMELHCIGGEQQNINYRTDDAFQKQISQVVRCLQEHSHQNLTVVSKKIHVPTFTSAFAPIIDGQIVPNHPKYSFSPKYGALFRDIDLMIGTVSYPAHHLLSNVDIENGVDVAKRDKILRTLVRNLFNFHRTEIFNAILNEYTDWDNPKHHPKTLRNNVLAALGDVLYTAPLIRTARMHSTDDVPKSSNTFLFVFAHETRAAAWTPSSHVGAATNSVPHGGIRGSLSDDHLPYILGFPLSSQHRDSHDYGRFTSDDKGISRVLMQYISNFVKSGDPAKPQSVSTQTTVEERFFGTPWPQYNPATREAYLEISDRPRVKNYFRNSYVGFWNGFVPQLNRDTRENNVPEEHNFLPDHFNKHSFFGTVRPYSSFHNDPFPPPPLPPTPFPIEAIKRPPAVSSQPVIASKPGESPNDGKLPADLKKAENYNLAITVAVGVGFLVLNLCIYVLMLRKCSERKRKSKKRLKYQSYTIGHPSTSEINFAPNSSSLGQFPPPPTVAALKTDEIKLPPKKRSASPAASSIATLRNGDVVSGRSQQSSAPAEGRESSVGRAAGSGSISSRRNSGHLANLNLMTSSLINNNNTNNTTNLMNASHHSSAGGARHTPYHPTQIRHSFLFNNGGGTELGGVNEGDPMTKSTVSTGGNSGGITTMRRISLKEQEPLLSANSKNSTITCGNATTGSVSNIGLIRPGISPTCPRHGRAAQMMLAAAAAAAVSRANSVGGHGAGTSAMANSMNDYGSGGGFGNGPSHVISSNSPTGTMLEEAQV